MTITSQISVAVVGAAGRGGSIRQSIDAVPQLGLCALCDLHEKALAKSARDAGINDSMTFTDYERMLDVAKPDAVIVGTPMPLHVPQSIAALQRGIHVISEVPAGVSIEECRTLVHAANASKATYMLAENYIFAKPVQVVGEMVRQGIFGEVYYAEGEYLHELKSLGEKTVWRRHWQNGIDGITYGTHSLGPILQWFAGQRVERVCCAGSGRHHGDPRGEAYAQDTSVMLCQLSRGGLAKVRVDMLSDRPHAMNNHQLQGKDACFESSRAAGEPHRFWARALCGSEGKWLSLEDVEKEFEPPLWARFEELAAKAGHGGGDLLELIEFADALTQGRPPLLGIHEAMDMTLPGLVSQQSIVQDGAWLAVPDSRAW